MQASDQCMPSIKLLSIAMVFLLREVGRLCFIVTSEAKENISYLRKIRKTTANKLILPNTGLSQKRKLEIKMDRNPPITNYKL